MLKSIIRTIVAIVIAAGFISNVSAAVDVENFDSTITVTRVNMPVFNGTEYSGFVEFTHTAIDGEYSAYAYVDCYTQLELIDYDLTDTIIFEDGSFASAQIMLGNTDLCLIETIKTVGIESNVNTYEIMLNPAATSFDSDLEYFTGINGAEFYTNSNNDIIMTVSTTTHGLAGIVLHDSVIQYTKSYSLYMPITTN